jgi:hypothetical protein
MLPAAATPVRAPCAQVLKLTPEKGLALLLALAPRLAAHGVQLRAVAGVAAGGPLLCYCYYY